MAVRALSSDIPAHPGEPHTRVWWVLLALPARSNAADPVFIIAATRSRQLSSFRQPLPRHERYHPQLLTQQQRRCPFPDIRRADLPPGLRLHRAPLLQDQTKEAILYGYRRCGT